MAPAQKKKVIIIGAGPSGLTAAFELLQTPELYDVTVLEESDVVGGISRTVRYKRNRMDIGGHRFFSKNDRVMNWWRERMPLQGEDSFDDRILGRKKPLSPGGPNPDKTDRVMLLRRRISRIYSFQKFFDYPIRLKWQTISGMGFRRTVKAGCSYFASAVRKRPENSLENFYINRFGKTLYRLFFESYTEKVWGRHPSEMSASWGAQRVKGLSVRAILKDMTRKIFVKSADSVDQKNVETSLIEEFWYPKYGPGQLWETVAGEVEAKGGAIRKGCRVTALFTRDGQVTAVEADTPEGRRRIEGDVFISSMPVKDLIAGFSGDPVPDDIRDIAAGLPYRDFITVGLLVSQLNLKNRTGIPTLGNIVPDCWIYIHEPAVKVGRLQIFNNWSPYMLEDPEHTVWIGMEYFCAEGDEMWSMSNEDFIAFATDELCRIGVITPGSVLDAHRENVKKAYPAYFDTYARMDELIAFLNGYGNLFCVGRNGQHRYNNMDHSMLTAFAAVDAIRTGSEDKNAVWNVNTEEEYHEEKA